ncbi:hypothetical protein F2A31_05850 [Acinetobacter suaedae]|uniref:DUF2787 domain-containing protein n=1 Tax=Acinetobacter suaedae TaxID=2609668 RepID=A0A5P1UTV6_9GAMM|nr:hypothetical protein [Acinetobacter sp. C16S1]QER39250.1 hypothetical protein F2A31_05850 [Acinetobacter sp. C16S1]
MKFSILDYKVLQFVFRADDQIIRFFNKPKKSDILPVKVKIVIPNEEEASGKEFLLIFRIDAKDFLGELEDGFFQLHFVVRFGAEEIIPENFDKTDWLESSLTEKGFPLVVSWLNNFFVNSGYNTYFTNNYHFEEM